MKRFMIALSAVPILCLGLVTAASASTVHVSKPVHNTLPNVIVAPHGVPIPTSPTASASASSAGTGQRNNGSTELWANDQGFGCTSNIWVEGYYYQNQSNEAVYFIKQANGYYNMHFKSCGNSWCVWQYGFGGNYNNLYMHLCNGNEWNDLFSITQENGGIYDAITEPNATAPYMTALNTPGGQMYTGYYVYGNSDWSFYTL